MHLPPEIQDYIQEQASRLPASQLRQACEALSSHYRGGRPSSALRLPPEVKAAAYLLMRLPATYAAACAALRELKTRLDGAPIESSLDLGAGPGTATLAARSLFPTLNSCSMAESAPEMRAAARAFMPGARVVAGDLQAADRYPEHDLVMASYVLGELAERQRLPVLARAWRATRVALLVIEPGSPQGFRTVREARGWLLEAGARIAAPCPAEQPCPVQDPDWCHFAARLERSSLLRRMKGAKLSYEDEKFSYIAASRQETRRAEARIVRRPEHAPGLVSLVLCRGQDIRKEAIPRRNPAFHTARKSRWGEAWPPDPA